MSKIYKLRINEGDGAEGKTISITQGLGDKGAPVRVLAQRGARYELQDDAKAEGAAPDQVRVKRVGKNLNLMFDRSQNADVVLENFYAEESSHDGGLPVLAGQAENGSVYEYIPQDPALSSVTSALTDGNTPVLMALGGGALGGVALGETFALAAVPLVAVAGGMSGWAVAGGALGAAALAGGGGGGGAANAGVLPNGQKGYLTRTATHDTGASPTDGYTQNNKPQLTIQAESGAKVVVTINGKDYPATETATKGVYTVDVGGSEASGKLADGVYTPTIKVSNATGTSSVNGDPFTIDTSTANNEDGKKTPNTVADENSQPSVIINLGSIDTETGSSDTGSSETDFVTSDGTLSFQGKVSGFVSNGDVVHLVVLNSAKVAVIHQYVTPNSLGNWTFNNQAATLPIGNYTIKASLEDLAGNVVKTAGDQPLTVAMPDTLVLRPETVSVLENDTVTTVAANGVLANDGDTTASAVKVIKIGGSDVIGSGAVTVTGHHGQLDMFADGHYEYRQTDNSLTAGQKVADTFTYEVQAVGTSRTQTATLTVDITGVNDKAEMTLSDANAHAIEVNGSTTFANAEAPIKISDADKNEAAIQGIDFRGETTNAGSLGTLTTTGDGQGNYGFSYAKAGTEKVDTNQHDLFSFTSIDATAHQTLDFVITASDAAKQEFNVAPLDNEHSVRGLKASGNASTTDTLKLHGSIDANQLTTFDFSDPAISTFESIEKIEMLGSGPNTVRLSLASLMQGDTSGAQTQQLLVSGDANDALYFTSAIAAVDGGLVDINSVQYHKYSFGSDELLVQAALANIIFS